jgi:hypothetical protein
MWCRGSPTSAHSDASLWCVWHVRQALWVQVGHQGFHGSTKGVERMLDAVLFKHPQHTIRTGGASHIDSVVGQFIHSGEIACEPVPVCHIETIAPRLEKGLTRF